MPSLMPWPPLSPFHRNVGGGMAGHGSQAGPDDARWGIGRYSQTRDGRAMLGKATEHHGKRHGGECVQVQ